MRKFNVTVNGTPYQVEIEEVSAFAAPATRMPAVSTASAPAAAIAVAVAPSDASAAAVPAAPAAPSALPQGGTKITSPMPGTIVKLAAKEGASINKGDTIVVLEAMKMENDIVATASGTVYFAVAQGQNINSGDVIAVIS